MPLNSPGGSTLQWGAGRSLMYRVLCTVCYNRGCNHWATDNVQMTNRPTTYIVTAI